jgi:phospholipase C
LTLMTFRSPSILSTPIFASQYSAEQLGRAGKLLPLLFAFAGVLLVSPRAFGQSASCPPSSVSPSVTVCLPAVNSRVASPAHVVASTTNASPVTTMQIYVDNKLVLQSPGNSLNTYVSLTLGNHLVTVQAWDSKGATFKTNVPVSMTPPCALSKVNQSVTICTPGAAAVVSTPVHLVAGATDSNPVVSMQLLIDGKLASTSPNAPLDVFVTQLATGKHTLKVTATDSTGVTFSASRAVTVTGNGGMANLRHIIFMVLENRSFDNYFGRLGHYRVSKGLANNIDGIPLNNALPNTQGQLVKPFHYQTVCTENLSPFWNESHLDVDGGKMDGFMQTSTSVPSSIDPTGTRAMGYYDETDLPYYYELATQFATSDRFFSPVESNTNANRMYLFAGTSFGHIRPDTPPAGGWTQTTLFDRLDAAGVSWRYYYQDNGSYLPQWATYQRDAAKLKPIASWYTDLQNEATLPSVIFIERPGPSGLDEHPGNNIQLGAANSKKIIDGLMSSPSWGSSVFILSYDEAGGLYDHVVPATAMKPDSIPPMLQAGDQPGDFANTGFRIPVTVISPWVKPHYVSHTWRDLTSILRLIETRFNVPNLTARDAVADNMMEFFDFSTPHWATPPPLPPQPTNGACNPNLEKAPGH